MSQCNFSPKRGNSLAELSQRCWSAHSLDSSGEPEGPDPRGSKAQGVHVSHVLDCVVECFHIITLQGEQGLRGVHVNLEVEGKKILVVPWQMTGIQAERDT